MKRQQLLAQHLVARQQQAARIAAGVGRAHQLEEGHHVLIVGDDAVEFLEQIEHHLRLPLDQRRAQLGQRVEHAERLHLVSGRAQRRDHVVFGAPFVDLLLAVAFQAVGRHQARVHDDQRAQLLHARRRSPWLRMYSRTSRRSMMRAWRAAHRAASRARTAADARCDRWRCAGPGGRRSDRHRWRGSARRSSRGLCARSRRRGGQRARGPARRVNTRCSSRSASRPRRRARARQLAAVVLRQRALIDVERFDAVAAAHRRPMRAEFAGELLHEVAACAAPARMRSGAASPNAAPARPQRSRRNPRSDGSAHTSRPGAARDGGWPGAPGSASDTARRPARTARASARGGAAGRRSRSRARPRAAGCASAS